MKGLRQIRERRGLTLQQIEDLTGIAGNTISRYERGVISPNSDTAQKIARALGVTVDELINGTTKQKWEIRLIMQTEGGENVDMTGKTSSATLNIGDAAMSITLSGSYELWEDDPQFEDFIADLRRKREIGLKAHKEGWLV